MSGSTIELGGIFLEIHNPRGYLEVLSHAIRTTPFYPPELRKRVTEDLRLSSLAEPAFAPETVRRVLGYSGHELIVLLDREWHDYENNEGDRIHGYMSSRRLFESVKSVFLWGAGTCRLADYLGSLESIDRIICTDLSWPALHFGKALVEANYAALPEPLTRARVFYHVDRQSNQLVGTTKDSHFKAPLTPPDRRHCIRYEVRDAFAALSAPIDADLIAVPYVLDSFRGDQCISVLVRICQHVRIGQQIVILVTCIAEGRMGQARDPAAFMDVLRRSGLKIQFVDLTFLPYSFSYYSFAEVHMEWNTLVVRAEKVADRDGDIIVERAVRRDESRANQADRPKRSASPNRELVMSKLANAENYQTLAAALAPQMGAAEFETAIGGLASRGAINLRFDAN